MNAFLTLINIIVLVIFIVILHMMARKHISFAKRVFTALGIGIVFGVLLHLIYGTHSNVITSTSDWFNIVGQGYVALLQMIVMPLIFISIVAAFTKIQIGEKFAKIGSLIFYLFNWHCHHCCDCWCCVCLGVWFRRINN